MLTIRRAARKDLDLLLPLMRAYCDFYQVSPSDTDLTGMSRALMDRPAEGEQLIAFGSEDESGGPLAFATIFWTWQTLYAARVGVLNDLFTVPESRGTGVGRALIERCRERCSEHGAAKLVWETAPDNHAAQRLYDGIGAEQSTWLTYEMDAD